MRVRGTAFRVTTIAVLLALTTHVALRAAPTDAEVQAARELFKQGEQDEDATHWADALDKFKRVAQVRSTAGVRYHIALCEEHLGQLAAALGDYTAAENQAKAEGANDVLKTVGPQIAALGPRVPRLTIRVIPDAPGMVVKLDGQPIAPGLVGVSIPLEVGVHRVEATAPQRSSSATTVTMHERDATSLDLKLGEPTAAPPPAESTSAAPAASAGTAGATTPAAPGPQPTTTAPESPPAAHGDRLPAITTGVLAVGLVGFGVAAFVVAGNQHSDGQTSCAAKVSSDPGACDSQKSSVRTWDTLALAGWVGGAAAGVLTVLLWTHSSSPRTSTSLLIGPGSLGLRGSF